MVDQLKTWFDEIAKGAEKIEGNNYSGLLTKLGFNMNEKKLEKSSS